MCVCACVRACVCAGADVIGLLETDAAKPFLGNHDMAMYLSEVLNMYTDYGPGPRHHTWG